MKIVTHYDPPPIPRRDADWTAVDDDTYGGPGSPIGTGATEAEAIADLLEQMPCKDSGNGTPCRHDGGCLRCPADQGEDCRA